MYKETTYANALTRTSQLHPQPQATSKGHAIRQALLRSFRQRSAPPGATSVAHNKNGVVVKLRKPPVAV